MSTENQIEIDLYNLQVSDKTAIEIGEKLRFAISIDLRGNQIGDNGAKAIAEALQVNDTLTSLCLCFNRIGKEG